MQEHEQRFFIAEFETAWAQVRSTEERRLRLLQFNSGAVVFAIGLASLLLITVPGVTVVSASAVTALMAAALVSGLVSLQLLLAERAVNVRYRRKINLIRGLLLGSSGDPGIRKYLEHREIGILTGDDPQPAGIGSTLRRILTLHLLQVALPIAYTIMVWSILLLGGR